MQGQLVHSSAYRDMIIMLQSLLSERFHLVFHREQRRIAGYALVVAKSSLKAAASAIGTTPRTAASFSAGVIDAQASTMASLAQKLSEALHVPVSDSTGLEGQLKLKTSWNPEDGLTTTGKSIAGVVCTLNTCRPSRTTRPQTGTG